MIFRLVFRPFLCRKRRYDRTIVLGQSENLKFAVLPGEGHLADHPEHRCVVGYLSDSLAERRISLVRFLVERVLVHQNKSLRRPSIDLLAPGLYVHPVMTKDWAAFLLAFLFILSGAFAAYSQCAQAGQHFDSGTEQEAPLIDCPEVASTSSIQTSSPGASYRNVPGKPLTSPKAQASAFSTIVSSRETFLLKPFFQRNLYQLEEIYRL